MKGKKGKRNTNTLLSSASISTRSISDHVLGRIIRKKINDHVLGRVIRKKIRKNTEAEAEMTEDIDIGRSRMSARIEKEIGIVTIEKRTGTKTIGTKNGAETKSISINTSI